MEKLNEYINTCFFYCTKTAGQAKQIHMAHAYGALEMYMIENPSATEACVELWETKWYPNFTEEIWGYRP